MSAELLRRAATKLRKTADRPHSFLMNWPWRVVNTDSEAPSGVAACRLNVHVEHEACDACWHFETNSPAGAEYIALMHPPVALAIADLLDDLATSDGVYDSAVAEIRLARAILREDLP